LDQATGKTVRYVGYGLTTIGDRSSGGIKRHNTAPLAQVSRLLLAIDPNPHGACEGDSGGPLLLDDGKGGESIIGVGSFVVNPACRRDSFYQRLDTQLDWVDAQIRMYDPQGGTPTGTDGGASDSGAPAPSDAAAPDPTPPGRPDAIPAQPPPAPDAAPTPPSPSPSPSPSPPPTPSPPPSTTT